MRPIYSSSKLRTAQMMIFSLVAMIGLEKCCITSAYLQWLCQVSETWPVGTFFLENKLWHFMQIVCREKPGMRSVAQSDVHLTGDRLQVRSAPESGNILLWRLIMKYFLWSFSSFPLIQEGQWLVSGKRMCTSTDYLLRGLSLSRKSVVR